MTRRKSTSQGVARSQCHGHAVPCFRGTLDADVIQFNCPTCNASLRMESAESTGPCPTCQAMIEVKVQISNILQDFRKEASEAPTRAWRCSGKPHGTFV